MLAWKTFLYYGTEGVTNRMMIRMNNISALLPLWSHLWITELTWWSIASNRSNSHLATLNNLFNRLNSTLSQAMVFVMRSLTAPNMMSFLATVHLTMRTTIVIAYLSLSCECDRCFDRIRRWSSFRLSSNIIIGGCDASIEALWISVVAHHPILIVNYVCSSLWDSPSDGFTNPWLLYIML